MSTNLSSSARQAQEALGARLREIRKDAGLSGRALAAATGQHFTRVSKLENGVQAPSDQDIRDWCRICGAEEQILDLIATTRAVESAYLEFRRQARAGMKRVLGAHSGPGGQARIGWFFAAGTGWNGEPVNREPAKHSGLAWIDLADPPEDLVAYTWAGLRAWQAGAPMPSISRSRAAPFIMSPAMSTSSPCWNGHRTAETYAPDSPARPARRRAGLAVMPGSASRVANGRHRGPALTRRPRRRLLLGTRRRPRPAARSAWRPVMSAPLVSVVIATRNRPCLLRLALVSVTAQ